MDLYKIVWKNSARKELEKIKREIIPKILKAIESLALNPFPAGVRKISGSEYTYRIRVGDYRIVYSIISLNSVPFIYTTNRKKSAITRKPGLTIRYREQR
ncbi:type II toxin-antitoxin system RelE/ParE family toxin, partial [candidate division TA06 bacterium]|nr:type II toxin-antitoxin system RelE/ParE family toxin [candidate division TA06 bacterium]